MIQPNQEVLPITFKLERRRYEWIAYDVSVEGLAGSGSSEVTSTNRRRRCLG